MKILSAWLRAHWASLKTPARQSESGSNQCDIIVSRRRTRTLRGVLVCLCLLLVIAGLSPAIKVFLQSVGSLLECNGDQLPEILKPLLDKNVISERVSIPDSSGRPITAILYTPAGYRNAPGLVIVPGLDPGGTQGLSGYARLEASCGLRVLTPDIAPLQTYNVANINNSDVNIIGESTRWLAHQTGHPVTLMGLSFGGGLALVAAAKEEYAPSVRLVFDVGGYDDISRVIHFYMTGVDTGPNGESTKVKPNHWVALFLQYTDLAILGSKQDASALEPILKARIIDAQHHPRNETQIISELVAKLSPEEARKLHALDEKASKLDFAELIDRIQILMRQVSPHKNLEGVTAAVYILHGLGDDVIPSEEALWLQKDLPSGRLKKILITPLISHVTIKEKKATLRDKWSLVYFWYEVHYVEMSPYTGNAYERAMGKTATALLAALILGISILIGCALLSKIRIWKVNRIEGRIG